MGKLGNACRARAAECVLVARAAGWRGDDALKAMYLTLAQQWALALQAFPSLPMSNPRLSLANAPPELRASSAAMPTS